LNADAIVWRRIMMFEMPHYEVRYHDKAEWGDISEIEVLESLQRVFVRVSPSIQDMIQGKQVLTPDATYRIIGNV
jgi:hypothetical protein